MSDEPRGPTTEELRARVLALHEELSQQWLSNHAEHCQWDWPHEGICHYPPPAALLARPCLACNREPGQRMCDLCTRLEIAEANAE